MKFHCLTRSSRHTETNIEIHFSSESSLYDIVCVCTWQADHRRLRRRRLPRWRRSKGAIYETVKLWKHGGRQKREARFQERRTCPSCQVEGGMFRYRRTGTTTTTVREDLILESAFSIQWQRHAAMCAKLAEVTCSQFISLWLAAGNWVQETSHHQTDRIMTNPPVSKLASSCLRDELKNWQGVTPRDRELTLI